eukprot:8767638-Prorocentrum_lima.AAC.1
MQNLHGWSCRPAAIFDTALKLYYEAMHGATSSQLIGLAYFQGRVRQLQVSQQTLSRLCHHMGLVSGRGFLG